MSRQTWPSIFGAALLMSAAHLLSVGLHAEPAPLPSAARQGGQAQTSSSTVKARRKNASSRSLSSSKSISSRTRRRSKTKVKGQKAPNSDRIKEIQGALQREGAYEGALTGKWDDATAEAMRKYQDKNGLNPTGKIDALSLEKLGLGSQTAGKAAPIPVATGTAPPPAATGTGTMPSANTTAPPAPNTAAPADPQTK